MAAKKAAFIFRAGQNADGSGPRNNPSKTLTAEWGTERETNEATTLNEIYNPAGGLRQRAASLEAYDVTLTGQLGNFGTRLSLIEGAAGFDPTALLGVKADADASRITQYVGRPGDAYQSWTTDVYSRPSTAGRIVLNANISINTLAKGGAAVLVKGQSPIGPIPWVWIEKGRVFPSRSVVARTLNDADGNNLIRGRIAYFNPDGSYVGIVECKGTTIDVAAGPTVVEFTISTEPGRSDYQFPLPEGGYARIFFQADGTRGEIAVAESNFGNLASLAQQIRASLGYTHIPDTALLPFYDMLTGVAGQISFLNIVEDIRGKLNPMTFPSYPADIVADQKTKVVLLPDEGRRNILLQNEKVDLAINFDGKLASFDQSSRSIIQYAGQSVEFGDVGSKAISIIARTPEGAAVLPTFPSPVFCRIDRLTVGYPQGMTYGDDVMAYWIDDADVRLRNAMRIFLNSQFNDGLLGPDGSGKMKMMFWPGATARNNNFNLANPGGKLFIPTPGTTGIVTTPYESVRGLGTDAYIRVNMLCPELGFSLDSHFMMTKPFDATLDNPGIAMGNSANLYVTANLTATQHATRSGTGRDTPSPVNPGSSICMNRKVVENYDTYQNGVFVQNFVRQLGTLPSGPLNLLATYGSAGYSAPSVLKWRYFLAGFGLQSAGSIASLQTALDKLQAANDQIRAAA